MSENHYLDDARHRFIGRLVDEARVATVDGTRSVLENGPAGRSPRRELVAMHRWFRSLEDGDKARVLDIVREAVDGAIFGTLLLLDQEDPYEEDRLYDFALYLQVYDDLESHETNQPSRRSEKINDALSPLPLRTEYLSAVERVDEESGDPQDPGER